MLVLALMSNLTVKEKKKKKAQRCNEESCSPK